MAQPATYNLTLYQGDRFELVVTIQSGATPTPVNLTGLTPSAHIRRTKDAVSPLATFECTVTDAPNGEITCVLPSLEAAGLMKGSVVPDGYWDLQTTDGAATPDVRTWLQGEVTIIEEVTR